MLSESQQKLLLKMLLKAVYRKDDTLISRNDVSELYKSKSSFFKSVRYLLDSDLVERVEIRYNVVRYRLTWRGEALARIICGLADMPEQFKDDASLLKVLLKLRIS